ncbi:Cystathionine gamma-synthase [Spiromyces aspiralis]|uniref:Cystathionine gamma-synthase n=1 Tax=Spiromyces aspiralis TaxID=68401 RepID=A0ACC1HXT9_9FUNG|nr:Cystathionine gamma-synthase [Spiromyces aspiralis]
MTDCQLGQPVPPNTKHAVSVSLPTWQDNVDYELGSPRVIEKMVSGYPRFFIAISIKRLESFFQDKFGLSSERAMLFSTSGAAGRCCEFIQRHSADPATAAQVRWVEYHVSPEDNTAASLSDEILQIRQAPATIYCVFFPADLFAVAKQYWQHTGDGISSRLAEHCLRIIHVNGSCAKSTATDLAKGGGGRSNHPVASRQRPLYHCPPSLPPPFEPAPGTPLSRSASYHREFAAECLDEQIDRETEVYMEERFGRNINLQYAAQAKVAVRRRIAGVLRDGEAVEPGALANSRGVRGLSEDDVYLTSSGMGAIFHTHRALLEALGHDRKSVCFGFPYTDTLKVLEKFGPGAYFFGHGEGADYDRLEEAIKTEEDAGQRILAVFTECPSNPLLKTADLPRLRRLADAYGFALVIDETIGSFVNIDTLSWADVVASSLTKAFSGDSNVMAGSIVLNPNRRFYAQIKQALGRLYEDNLWCEDALFLERNSRNFCERVATINRNAEFLCEMLRSHPSVAAVHYPKYTTPDLYNIIKRDSPGAGYGGLLSVIFKDEADARIFYDSLDCCKGPSLGTNFTLVSPYTILAHFNELEWARQYGVTSHLIRVSVGLERQDQLLQIFGTALDAITKGMR